MRRRRLTLAFRALPTLVVARAVLTALLDVSNIPKAVPTPGTSPRAATTVPAASLPALERLLPTRPFLLRPVTVVLLKRLGYSPSVSDSRPRDSSWQALLQRQPERTRELVVERSTESLPKACFQEAKPARGRYPMILSRIASAGMASSDSAESGGAEAV